MDNFLDFFAVKDWLGRPEPYEFNIEKIILALIFAVACCIVPIVLKKNPNATRKVILCLWIIAVVLDVVKYVFYNAYCIANKLSFNNFELPLWTCSIYLFALPISLFSKNEKVKNACNGFICSISMIGGIINFLFSAESVLSFMGMHTFLYHYILLITPIIMLVTGYYMPKTKDVKGAILIFIVYGIPVYIFNSIFKQDYMFIYNGTWFGPVADFAELMPNRFVWTLICVTGHAIVTALMIYLESKITKSK